MKKIFVNGFVNGKEIEIVPSDLKTIAEKFLVIRKSELIKFLESDKDSDANRFVVIKGEYVNSKYDALSKGLEEPVIVDSVFIKNHPRAFTIAAFNYD